MSSDHHIRLKALDPGQSFIVQAPAGSGKTEVLTQRFLRLLASVERPERVLAITFTRKATQEMRSRINERLRQALNGEIPEADHDRRAVQLAKDVIDRDRELGWNLTANPGRLRITTIDGLCAQLLSRDPAHGPQWSGVSVLEDARPLYREAVRRLYRDIDTLADNGNEAEQGATILRQALVSLLTHLGGDSARLEALLMDMLARRSLWKRHLDATIPEIESLLKRRQEHAVQAFESALGVRELARAKGLASELGLEVEAASGDTLARLLACHRFATFLCTKALKPRGPGGINRGLFPAMAEAQRPLLNEFREIYANWHANERARDEIERMAAWPPIDAEGDEIFGSDQLLDQVRSVLLLALSELENLFGETGQADFTAISDVAVKALGSENNPGETLLAEDNRIDHILMDEFQDTSFMQFRLLLGLISGWQPGDGRTLFLVGDPMQSIYRFREANVGFFNEIVQTGHIGSHPIESLSLSSNFRSRDELIDWYNRTFPEIFPPEDETDSGAVTYTPVNAEVGEGGEVGLHALAVSDDSGGQSRMVSQLVSEALEESEDQTIAVLVRSRRQVAAIADELANSGIAFEAVNMRPLAEQAVIQDLLIVTRALMHPLDRVAWLALLRAPWCALTVAEMHLLMGDDPAREVLAAMEAGIESDALAADSRQRLARVSKVMRRARDLAASHSLSERVAMCWTLLGGPALCKDSFELEDAEVYLDLLSDLETTSSIDIEQRLDEALDNKYAGSRPARVQLMTIHGAKGLQFDVVIVPALAQGTRQADKPLLALQEFAQSRGESGVLMAALVPSYVRDASLYRYLVRVDQERGQFEGMRLLYVACTRARKRLHLVAEIKVTATGKASVPANSFLKYMEQAFSPAIDAMLAGFEPVEDETAEPEEPPAFPMYRLDCALPEPEFGSVTGDQPIASLRALPNREAAALGTVLHQWLELVHDHPDEVWDRDRIERSADSIRSCLAREGVRSDSLDSLCDKCREILCRLLFDEHWLEELEPRESGQSWSELPVYRREGSRFTRHVIDLLVQDDDGTFRIIDYKTHTPSQETDWAGQLERYRELVERLSRGTVAGTTIKVLEPDD